MSSHSHEQPTSYGRPIPQNAILYTNVPPMSRHLRLKATFSVSQRWLLIAGSTVVAKRLRAAAAEVHEGEDNTTG